MSRPAPTRAPKVSNLRQQQTDFTAEGSPPPGKVATSVPVTKGKTTKAASPGGVRGAHKPKSSGEGR
jgi:hypothetical protein